MDSTCWVYHSISQDFFEKIDVEITSISCHSFVLHKVIIQKTLQYYQINIYIRVSYFVKQSQVLNGGYHNGYILLEKISGMVFLHWFYSEIV